MQQNFIDQTALSRQYQPPGGVSSLYSGTATSLNSTAAEISATTGRRRMVALRATDDMFKSGTAAQFHWESQDGVARQGGTWSPDGDDDALYLPSVVPGVTESHTTFCIYFSNQTTGIGSNVLTEFATTIERTHNPSEKFAPYTQSNLSYLSSRPYKTKILSSRS